MKCFLKVLYMKNCYAYPSNSILIIKKLITQVF